MQPNGPDRTGVAGQGELLGDVLGDLAGLDAAGAHVEALRGAVDDRPDPLDVGVPPSLRATVRVADVHPEGRALAAHHAHCCHSGDLTQRGPDELTGLQDPERLPVRRGTRQPAVGDRAPAAGSYDPPAMTSLTRLGADELRAVVAGYRDALAAHKEGINRLNVYRSEEHTSELQSLMRNSYAVFCLKKKKPIKVSTNTQHTRVRKKNTLEHE